jgi:hypothetical protein
MELNGESSFWIMIMDFFLFTHIWTTELFHFLRSACVVQADLKLVFSCLSLLRCGIKGIYHHTWLWTTDFLKVIIFLLIVLGFELRAYTLSHSTCPFFFWGLVFF